MTFWPKSQKTSVKFAPGIIRAKKVRGWIADRFVYPPIQNIADNLSRLDREEVAVSIETIEDLADQFCAKIIISTVRGEEISLKTYLQQF